MSDLDDVVRVVIFDQTTAITTASFQIPLVLGTFTNFSERARNYKKMSEVSQNFDSDQPVYKMAERLFGQTSVLGAPPPEIVIGRRQVDEVTIAPVVANNRSYTVTIDNVAYSYLSDANATATEITDGLETAIGAIPGISVASSFGVLTIGVTTSGAPWSLTSSDNLPITFVTPTESYVDALSAVEQVNSEWYCLVCETQAAAEQEALSDAIQAREKIYGLSSSDTSATTTAITDIGYKLSAKAQGRTFGVYLPTSATEYPEAAWVGSQLAVTPGQNDWDFKRASGITVSNLSSTAMTNLANKNWNYYIRKAGVNIFMNGNMFDNKPIDIQIGKDWLKARLQEAIYFRLINILKIPLTDSGLVIIENEIRSVMSLAQSNNLIDSGWSVTTPPVASIPETLRAQRAAGVFVIQARLAGSVRFVDLEVYLSV